MKHVFSYKGIKSSYCLKCGNNKYDAKKELCVTKNNPHNFKEYKSTNICSKCNYHITK